MFLLLYSGFLLFDYYPDQVVKSTVIDTEHIKVTITELLVIIFVFIYLIDEIREVSRVNMIFFWIFENLSNLLTLLLKLISDRNSDRTILSKLRAYYSNKWNIFDSFMFSIYLIGFFIRFSPIGGHIFWIRDENAFEIARYSLTFLVERIWEKKNKFNSFFKNHILHELNSMVYENLSNV